MNIIEDRNLTNDCSGGNVSSEIESDQPGRRRVTYDTLLVEKKDGVAVVTLNRPAKRNAMSPQLHRDMTAALDALRDDAEAHVVVITGAGDVFCAGMDLKEFFVALKDKPAEYEAVWKLAVEWRGRTLRYYPKPIIAMVNGFCFGGAFSIVEGCDLRALRDQLQAVSRRLRVQVARQPDAAARCALLWNDRRRIRWRRGRPH